MKPEKNIQFEFAIPAIKFFFVSEITRLRYLFHRSKADVLLIQGKIPGKAVTIGKAAIRRSSTVPTQKMFDSLLPSQSELQRLSSDVKNPETKREIRGTISSLAQKGLIKTYSSEGCR